jgi:syntaxin 18
MELTNLLDAVQETETKMIEMSALNHLMSTHVLQQAQQIQYLYDQVGDLCNSLSQYLVLLQVVDICVKSAPYI